MQKVSALTDKSLNLLTALDSVFRLNDMDKRSDRFVQNQECRSNMNHIIWSIEKSAIKEVYEGGYIDSPAISKCTPAIRKMRLSMNGNKVCNRRYVSLVVQFRNSPKDMFIEGEVSVQGEDCNLLKEAFSGHTSNLKEINFDTLLCTSELFNYFVDNKLNIQFRINSNSHTYKCVSDKSVYEVHYSPEIINFGILMQNIKKYSDVIFDIDARLILCHKCILASESTALSILFKSSNLKMLDMHDKSTATIEDLLHFIYCGNIRLLKFSHICQLYIAADEFEVLNLKDVCTLFLSSSLSQRNVPYILELAMNYKDQYLIEACIKFIKQNNIISLKETFMERSLKVEN